MPSEAVLQASRGELLVVVLLIVGFAALAGLLFVRKAVFLRSIAGGNGSDRPDSETNCPACGARVRLDRETCEHCGEPLAGSA